VNRMAQNSFARRGWSVTLVSVLFALIASKDAPPLAPLLAVLPTVVFWGLDAYYLRQERLLRHLYNAVSASDAGVAPFSMSTSAYARTTSWRSALFSRTVLPIPCVLALVAVGYTVVNALR
jgi:hypothetical protein